MGKRQHQKDKMYITCAEYTQFYGGKKAVLLYEEYNACSHERRRIGSSVWIIQRYHDWLSQYD